MKDIKIRVILPNGKSVVVEGKQYDCNKREDRLGWITDEIRLTQRGEHK